MKFQIIALIGFLLLAPVVMAGVEPAGPTSQVELAPKDLDTTPHPNHAGEATAVEKKLAAIDRLVDTADDRFDLGLIDQALEGYRVAAALASDGSHEDAVHVFGYIRYKQGAASWRRFEITGRIDYVQDAIGFWQQEHKVYGEHNYPAAHRALVQYDLANAHFALSIAFRSL